MRKYLFILLFFIFASFVMVESCKPEPEYTSEKQAEALENEDENEIRELKVIGEKQPIFLKKIADLFEVTNKCEEIEDEYLADISSLEDKFNTTIDNPEKKKIYAELLVKKYDKFINDYKQIQVPIYIATAHDYYLKFLSKERLYFVRSIITDDLDNIEELEELRVEIDIAYNKYASESNNWKKALNEEARELRFEEPFPDVY